MSDEVDVRVCSFKDDLPPFQIGDRILVCDPDKEDEMQRFINEWEVESGMDQLADLCLHCCWVGVMAGRSDDAVCLDHIKGADGSVVESTRQWIKIDKIVAVFQRRKENA